MFNIRRLRLACLEVIGLLGAIGAHTELSFADEPPATKAPTDFYDRIADGEKQVTDALVQAKRDYKRVLLNFGVNDDPPCQRLAKLFAEDKDLAHLLLYEYVVVPIDVGLSGGKMRNLAVAERYGQPTNRQPPTLVILDAEGKRLASMRAGTIQHSEPRDMNRLTAFLNKSVATPPSADEILTSGLAQAKADEKAVFVNFSAPWCGWCRRLDEYLHRSEIAAVFDSAYVTVKIDVDRFKGGKEMNAKYGGDQAGLPFFVVLDPDGKKLADSFAAPGSNVGFPAKPEEIEHFVKIVRQSAPKLTDAQIAMLEAGLKSTGKPDATTGR